VTAVVVDTSIAVTWCFEDEATAGTDALFERIRDQGAIVPALWHLELANVLLQAERRGRIGTGEVAVRLDLISQLPIATDPGSTPRAWREILSLARVEGLTTYDATYLELALRQGATLLTKDRELAEAALRRGVAVLPK